MSELTIPDVGGRDATVKVLTQMLYVAAMERRKLDLTRVANGHSEGDPVAGEEPLRDDGTVNSYELRLGELSEQERRLAEAYPEEIEIVREHVRKRDKETGK